MSAPGAEPGLSGMPAEVDPHVFALLVLDPDP